MMVLNNMAAILPTIVQQMLVKLGRNIRIARLRRNLRLSDMAERVGVSRYLMADVERGKQSAGIGAYAGALWVLGLLDDLGEIADPDNDTEGKVLESLHAPKTATKRKKVLDNDF